MTSPLPISANFNTSFSDVNTGLLGADSATSGSSSSKSTEQLQIDSTGIMRLIAKALEGAGGLSEIFSTESGAGLFSSSVAKGETEDLLAKIAGELALVTGTIVKTEDINTASNTENEGIFDILGGDTEIGQKLVQPGIESASGLNLIDIAGDLFGL